MPARARHGVSLSTRAQCLTVSLTLARTILKIFWTLMEWDVEQKIKGAFMAFANRRD